MVPSRKSHLDPIACAGIAFCPSLRCQQSWQYRFCSFRAYQGLPRRSAVDTVWQAKKEDDRSRTRSFVHSAGLRRPIITRGHVSFRSLTSITSPHGTPNVSAADCPSEPLMGTRVTFLSVTFKILPRNISHVNQGQIRA